MGYNNKLSDDEIRLMSIISYLGPLFIVARIINKKRSYIIDFHSWQGGILFFTITIAYSIVGYIANGGFLFPILREVLGIILYFGVSVGGIILIIMGIKNAYNKAQVHLPLIGDIDRILRKHYQNK